MYVLTVSQLKCKSIHLEEKRKRKIGLTHLTARLNSSIFHFLCKCDWHFHRPWITHRQRLFKKHVICWFFGSCFQYKLTGLLKELSAKLLMCIFYTRFKTLFLWFHSIIHNCFWPILFLSLSRRICFQMVKAEQILIRKLN